MNKFYERVRSHAYQSVVSRILESNSVIDIYMESYIYHQSLLCHCFPGPGTFRKLHARRPTARRTELRIQFRAA
jgi:hypothetical protein